MCFSIYFFIFSLKKIGYILKIHNFAPSRIRLVYEYFKKRDAKSLKKSKRGLKRGKDHEGRSYL